MRFVENIQDLKENRNYIIGVILSEDENADVKKVMEHILHIVTASNYISLDIDLDETIYRAMTDAKRCGSTNHVDEILRSSAINNLPSSMR